MKLKFYLDEYLIKLNGISVILLIIFGVFLVSSATAVESQRIYSDSFYMIANHGLAILIGVVAFFPNKKIQLHIFIQISYSSCIPDAYCFIRFTNFGNKSFW